MDKIRRGASKVVIEVLGSIGRSHSGIDRRVTRNALAERSRQVGPAQWVEAVSRVQPGEDLPGMEGGHPISAEEGSQFLPVHSVQIGTGIHHCPESNMWPA